MTRRLTLIGVFAAGVLLAALALLPWWWGAALRFAASRAGADFSSYRQIGYTRWELTDVTWTGPAATVHIDRLEAGHPLAWWAGWSRERGILVSGWTVELHPTDQPREPDENDMTGWRQMFDRLGELRGELINWVPEARATDGRIEREDEVLRVAEASWSQGRLEAKGLRLRGHEASARVDWPIADEAPEIELAAAHDEWSARAELGSAGFTGSVRWRDERASISAEFGDSGWMPQTARLDADRWTVPGSWIGLEAYYPQVEATLSGEWQQDSGHIVVAASGEPAEGVTAPPLQVDLRAEGGLERVTVSMFRMRAPGLEATLDRPLVIDPNDPLTGLVATLQAEAQLTELTASAWQGNVSARVQVEPVADGYPRIRAVATVEKFRGQDWAPVDARVEATLEWPRLELVQLRVSDAAGSAMDAAGAGDVAARQVDEFRAEGRIVRATAERWLPPMVEFEELAWHATARGPIDALEHEGEVRTQEVAMEPIKPAEVVVGWHGRMSDVAFDAKAAVPNGNAQLDGRVTAQGAVVESLVVATPEGEVLRSTQPAEVRWSPRWVVKNLRVRGPEVELAAEVDVVGQGRVGIEAPRLDLEWLDAWLLEPLPVREAEQLRLRGMMEEGALVFEAGGSIRLLVGENDVARLDVSTAGTREHLVVQQLDVQARGERVMHLEGRLPVVVRPGEKPWLHIDRDGAVAVNGTVARQRQFWDTVARATGVRVEQPSVDVAIDGTWNEPRGSLQAEAARLEVDTERWPGTWPVVTSLQLVAGADGERVRIQKLSLRVEGQPMELEANLPLSRETWQHLRASPVDYLREHGSGRLVLPEVELSAFARLVPEYLAPAGRAEARIEWTRDGLQGFFRLNGAVSRPLGPLGILQEISADLRFAGREVRIQNVSARMGGQPIQLTGRAGLSTGGPQVDLKLTGKNLPLVRQTGVLLRGDLDLALETNASGEGQVTGLVRLTDGLFLADLQDVVPRGSGVSRPAARPPYFSVAVEPLRDWKIDVRVEGSEFLRLHTPVLESTASARFQLTGTLFEPRAIGEAVLEGGIVRLPFAVFTIEEGEVRLTQADPFEPRLSLIGSSRRMGYDLRMELTGTATDPRLQFSSSPPLSSEEILLLVMAGQAPQEEVAYTGSQRAMQIGTFLGRGVIGDIFGGSGAGRLTITTGERVSRQGRETYRFSYELTPRLSLVGEYDEFDSYNAGLRWQVLPRKSHVDDAGAAADDATTGDAMTGSDSHEPEPSTEETDAAE